MPPTTLALILLAGAIGPVPRAQPPYVQIDADQLRALRPPVEAPHTPGASPASPAQEAFGPALRKALQDDAQRRETQRLQHLRQSADAEARRRALSEGTGAGAPQSALPSGSAGIHIDGDGAYSISCATDAAQRSHCAARSLP